MTKKVTIIVLLTILVSIAGGITLFLLLNHKNMEKICVQWKLDASTTYPLVNGGCNMYGEIYGVDYDDLSAQLPTKTDVEIANKDYTLMSTWSFYLTDEIRTKIPKYSEDKYPMSSVIFSKESLNLLIEYGFYDIEISTSLAPQHLSYTIDNGKAIVTGLSDLYGKTIAEKREAVYKMKTNNSTSGNDTYYQHAGVLVIPETFRGYRVTEIADGAFKNYNLSGFFSKSISQIGREAFQNCTTLEVIFLTSDIKYIGPNAFENCSPDPVICYKGTQDGWNSFEKKGVAGGNDVLLNSVIYGYNAVDYSWMEAYGWDKGKRNRDLIRYEKIKEYGTLLYAKEDVNFRYFVKNNTATIVDFKGSSRDVEIPDSIEGTPITKIWRMCFKDELISTLRLGNNLRYISSKAFANCEKLSNVYVPNERVWINIDFYDYQSNPFADSTRDKKLYVAGSIVTQFIVPDGSEKIYSHCFDYIECISSVVLPVSIKEIGAMDGLMFDDIYYRGTSEQWSKINIDDPYEQIINGGVNIHYNYVG